MTEQEAQDFAGTVASAFGKVIIDDEWVGAFVSGLQPYTMSEATDALERIYAQGAREYAPNVTHVVAEIKQARIAKARRSAVDEYGHREQQIKPLTATQRRDIVNSRCARRLHQLETPFEPESNPVPAIKGETTIRYTLNVGGVEREYVRASPEFCRAYETQTRNMKAAAEARRRNDPKVLERTEQMRRDLLKAFSGE